MATILLLGVDLYIRGKLEAVVPEHRFQTADGVEPPDLVIADIARIEPLDVTDTYPDVPVLGYTNHTDTAGLRGAHAAGFDQVVAKSALFERTRELIEELLTTVE
jgi:DNA-binding NarL/FixJ family response regulator